jgi:hypothetical protein
MVGDVSANEDYYHVIPYDQVVDAVGGAFEAEDIEPTGYLQLSGSGHRLFGHADIPGVMAEPADGDVIDLGLQFQAGQTGYHGIHYDVGARREVCSNGMQAFVSDLHFGQTHQKPLNYTLPRHAVTGIVDGVTTIEDRLKQADQETFSGIEEALLVLVDYGLDGYLDDPISTLEDSLGEELDPQQDQPTLYDTYNAATRAITNEAELSAEQRDVALDRAAYLLDAYGDLPEAEQLGTAAIEQRVGTYVDDPEVEPYWDNEEETLHELLAARSDEG